MHLRHWSIHVFVVKTFYHFYFLSIYYFNVEWTYCPGSRKLKILKINAAKFDIKNNLKDFGIIEEEFREKLDGIAKEAVADACTSSNPRKTEFEDMKKILEYIYEGKEIDF